MLRVVRSGAGAGAFFSLTGLAGGGTNAGGGILLPSSPTSSSDSSIGGFVSIATISNESFCKHTKKNGYFELDEECIGGRSISVVFIAVIITYHAILGQFLVRLLRLGPGQLAGP